MPSPTTPRIHLARVGALAVVLLTLLALGGGRIAATVAQARTVRADPASIVVGDVSYRITHVEQVTGLADADLGGMSHGIQGLVTEGKALVNVTLVVTADGTGGAYDAGVLRVVGTSGSTALTAPVGGTLAAGRLRPHSHIEGSLSFVVPRNGAQLALRDAAATHLLPLLRVDSAHLHPGAHQHTPEGRPAP